MYCRTSPIRIFKIVPKPVGMTRLVVQTSSIYKSVRLSELVWYGESLRPVVQEKPATKVHAFFVHVMGQTNVMMVISAKKRSVPPGRNAAKWEALTVPTMSQSSAKKERMIVGSGLFPKLVKREVSVCITNAKYVVTEHV